MRHKGLGANLDELGFHTYFSQGVPPINNPYKIVFVIGPDNVFTAY